MTKEEILQIFSDINQVYNNSTKYDTLKRLLDELTEQKEGYWIKGYTFPDGDYWKCNKCNELIKVKFPMAYCSNCGAKMEREAQDD